MNKVICKNLKKLLDHAKHYNNLAPFPVYDTSWVKDVEDRLKFMKDTKENYDELPVVACKYCKSLHIITDEDNNDICFRCSTYNELITFKNIFDYEKFVKKQN